MAPRLYQAAFVAALALGMASCVATAPEEVIAPAELDMGATGVAFEGAPPELRVDLTRNVEGLLSRFVETGKRAFIDDAAYETELFLTQSGYARAQVDYQILGENTALIEIKPGSRSTIGRVLVESNEGCPIPDDSLRLYVNGPRTGLFGSGAMLYVENRIEGAPDQIVEDLVALGYLDAEASLEDPGPRAAGGPVDVIVKVSAGERYFVSDARVRLSRTAEAIGPELERELDKELRKVTVDKDGKPREYEPRMEGKIRTVLADVLGQGGYPDASLSVEPKIDRGAKRVDLDVVAFPGPYVRLAEVRFEGSERTRDSFIASRLLFDSGDPYNSRKVRDTVRGLYRTGLFSLVSPRLEGAGDARSLVVEITEQPSREVFFEPGFGSWELARLTIGARDRNLFGNGIGASAEAAVAQRALRANASLTDPWLFRRDLIGDLRAEFNRREEPSFTRESRGVGAFITKEWTRAASSTIGYKLSRSEAKNVQAVDADVLEAQSVVNVASFILTQRYDIRDALFAPTKGVYAEASLEAAGQSIGSELEFIRPKLTAAWFEPVGADDVIGIGLRTGVIVPIFGEDTIPIQERFFAGGENSVRSFRESQLGPKDESGQPLGGEGFATASVEWRHELGGAFQSAVFVDAGLVELKATDLFRFESVRMGVGAGIRYLLPIGPIRIDAAMNPDRRSGEAEWVVSFGIGMPF
ncbi:Translocation and assembly module TamA precursor [Planctomycetes bacterium Poly30]|uniref:Translocation and assembly module TamA n=1 Tax=Saltatorellus ferox TaxID=2528018 RepID=A0A518EN53_9BACT|nr:Translocation and assembly module TamA precursor [Planctomycetes bacterium Poly30]